MKNLFVLITFILFSISCKTSDKTENTINQKKISDTSVKKDGSLAKPKKSIDTLSVKNAKFNEKLLFSKYSQLAKKKDSIKTISWDCGNPFNWKGEEFIHIFIKSSEYVTNNDDVVLLRSSFEGEDDMLQLTVDNRKEKFNNKTTIENFKLLFPNSEISDYTDENGGYVGYVSFNTNVPEDHWNFYFNNEGFLEKFELHWWLC